MQRTSSVIGKKYREYLVPTVLTSMATQISSFVDSVMASNFVCSKSIAAISLVMPILQLLYSITLLFGLGAASLISRSQGENDRTTANRYFSISFFTVLIISILAVIVQLPFAGEIVQLFTDDVELQQLAHDYYVPFIAGIPIYMLLFCAIHAVRIDGRPQYASAIMIVANVVNLVVDYVLMGVFKMGIAGSSWATLVGNGVGFAMVLVHFAQGKSSLKLQIRDSLQKNIGGVLFRRLFTTGISGAMGALFIVLRLQFFVSVITAISGAVGLVAFSLCTTVSRLISMFIAGASQAMIPIVSLCLGERDYQGVRFVLRRAVRVLAWASGLLMLYFLLLPDTFIQLYGITNAEERTLSHTALIINALSIPGEAFLFLFLYYFMAVGNRAISSTLSGMYGLGVLVFGYVMSQFFGINGVFWSMVATNFVALLVAFFMVLYKKNQSKGKFPDLFLVPQNDQNDVASFSIVASKTNATAASAFVQKFLESNAQLGEKAVRIALSVEEITVKIAEKNSKKTEIDIRISNENGAIISIRDNGVPCNPILPNGDEKPLSSLHVLQSISSKLDYSQVLGFNRTLIVI